MGWTLNSDLLERTQQLDEFFLAIGKALCLASTFEAKCTYILRIINVTEYHKNGGQLSDKKALSEVLKAKLLGRAISEIRGFPDFSDKEIKLLERARDARNFIAHEGANLGWPLSCVTPRTLRNSLSRLGVEAESLAAGDNLVSRWVFEIEEKEPAPKLIQRNYPEWVQEWILSKFARR